jgi:hypothetical protein
VIPLSSIPLLLFTDPMVEAWLGLMKKVTMMKEEAYSPPPLRG